MIHNLDSSDSLPDPAHPTIRKVWKVGSRWSYDGNAGSSILSIFRRLNVVFVGTHTERFLQIKEGDLITISDGKKVVALGVAHATPKPLPQLNLNFTDNERSHLDTYDESIIAVRLSFTDLDPSDYVDYCIGAFHGVSGKADKFRQLYSRYQQHYQQEQSFEINARSCTLLSNTNKPDDVLWKDKLSFQVPVYQRSYSWGEQEVRRLLGDLLTAFFGRNGRSPQEPMFVGTMQLAAPVMVDGKEGIQQQDIIDGQQRSTTLILTLKALQLLAPSSATWQSVNYSNRLTTAVNGGIQQSYLAETLENDCASPELDSQNAYQRVLHFILDELKNEEGFTDDPSQFEHFINYLVSKVYFVVIETRANLSKTLQIFDAINTSGMDLNGGDVFKVRYYEYLREKSGADESVFEDICALYEKIDTKNREAKREVTSMESVLRLAHQLVMTEAGMGSGPRSLAGTTFFERFFDTVLNVNRWEGFSKDACHKVELTIEKLDALIDLQFSWEDDYQLLEPEPQVMSRFIGWTRYARYRYMIQMFRYRFSPSIAELEAFILQFSKLLSIISIRSKKAVNDGHHKMIAIMQGLCCPAKMISQDDLLELIQQLRHQEEQRLTEALTYHNIAHIPKAKNLVCRLSAMLDELQHSELTAKQLHSLLFDTKIDIEHIESANHEDLTKRAEVHKEWNEELHRIGNLIILEFDINRSISNGSYTTVKRPRYADSKFVSVRNLAKDREIWSQEHCQTRKDSLISELTSYLCL